MCTLTLVAQESAYRFAMNRDERIARGAETPPEAREFDGTRALSPGDGAGGTWIGINEYGIALALLNWNETASLAAMDFRTRGQVIPSLIASRSLAEWLAATSTLDLVRVRPFRLVGVFPAERTIRECRWDFRNLEIFSHPWALQHWFSSGLSDVEAQRVRGAACSGAQREADAGSSAWLRRLHASHSGGPAFGVCVHRNDVQTLSYTEISYAPDIIALEHFLGNPCLIQPSRVAEWSHLSLSPLAPATQPASLLPL